MSLGNTCNFCACRHHSRAEHMFVVPLPIVRVNPHGPVFGRAKGATSRSNASRGEAKSGRCPEAHGMERAHGRRPRGTYGGGRIARGGRWMDGSQSSNTSAMSRGERDGMGCSEHDKRNIRGMVEQNTVPWMIEVYKSPAPGPGPKVFRVKLSSLRVALDPPCPPTRE